MPPALVFSAEYKGKYLDVKGLRVISLEKSLQSIFFLKSFGRRLRALLRPCCRPMNCRN